MKPERTMRRWVGEFGVIVLGVAAALGADNLREAHIERSLARDYLLRLAAELEAGAPTLATHQGRVDSALEAMDVLLSRTARGAPLTPEDSASLMLRAGNYGFNPAGVVLDLTYREMLATGSLNHVRDPSIREAISQYYRGAYQLADVLEQRRAAGVQALSVAVEAETGGNRRALLEDSSLVDEAMRRRLLGLVRASDSERTLRRTRAGVLNIRDFLAAQVERNDELRALLREAH
jgi:hypothetical protein